MTVACTNTLVRLEMGQSTDGRTAACAEITGQQLLLPFTTLMSEVGDCIYLQESQAHVPAAVSIEELQSTALAAIISGAPVKTVHRRKSMSRRTGQDGSIELRNGAYRGRYLIDVPGQVER